MPDAINFFMTVVSCFSIGGCLVVFYCLLQLDRAHRNKVYNKIIFCVVLSDFFSAIGTSFGTQKDNTFECSLQAFLTIAFPLCSIFWSTITFYLFYLAVRNRPSGKYVMTYLHCLCWGLPIVLTLLPLTVGLRYGVKEGSDQEWCSLSNPNDVAGWELTFWTFASFYFWLWISVGGYSVLIIMIYYELNSRVFFETEAANERLRPIVKKMIVLPVVIIICWTIPTCYRIYFYINNENVYVLQLLSAMSASSKGFLTSVLLIASHTVFLTWPSSKSYDENDHIYPGIDSKPSSVFRNSSGSAYSGASASLHDHILQNPRRSTQYDDDDDDDYDRYLFRVHNERISALSGDSGFSGVNT